MNNKHAQEENDPDLFPELNFGSLRIRVDEWTKNYSVIQRVLLYDCLLGLDEGPAPCKYVLVVEHRKARLSERTRLGLAKIGKERLEKRREKLKAWQGKDQSEKQPKEIKMHRLIAEEDNDYVRFINDWQPDNMSEVATELARVYKDPSKVNPLDWFIYRVEPDEGLPDDLVFKKKYWVLLERENQEGANLLASGATESLKEPTIVFRQNEDALWEIGFDGKVIMHRSDLLGFRYIHYLLQHPMEWIESKTLYELVTRRPATTIHYEHDLEERNEDGLEATDETTLRNLIEEEKYLAREIEELKKASESPILSPEDAAILNENINEAQQKINDCRKYRKQSTYAMRSTKKKPVQVLHKNKRRIREHGSSEDKWRMSVRKAILGALAEILGRSPELKEYFTASAHNVVSKPTIKTGVFCQYSPDPQKTVSLILS
jgi:hypothetical protein